MEPAEIERLLESPDHDGPGRRGQRHGLAGPSAGRRPTSGDASCSTSTSGATTGSTPGTSSTGARSGSSASTCVDKPRDVLYELARSERPMERRTAILSTFAFIRRGDLDDTYRDRRAAASTTTTTWCKRRSAGCCARPASATRRGSLAFLDAHAATMPRVMLRYAIEKLDPPVRARYLER